MCKRSGRFRFSVVDGRVNEIRLGRLGDEFGGGADPGHVAQAFVYGQPVGAPAPEIGKDADKAGVAGEIIVRRAEVRGRRPGGANQSEF
jgi:hypothetical protein